MENFDNAGAIMYYEEKQEGLVWYWRGLPNAEWIEFSVKKYQEKIVELQEEIRGIWADAAGIDI